MTYRHFALLFAIALAAAACGKSELEKQTEETSKRNAEINLRNVVGVMEYCAGKGYLDRKLITKQKEEFATDLDAETLTLAEQAYQQGRKGNLILRMNVKAKEGEAGQDVSAAERAKIDVTFTRKEQQNGELAIFCRRTELWAAREAAAAKQARNRTEGKSGDQKKESSPSLNEPIWREDR